MSLKKEIIRFISATPEVEGFEKNKLILTTAFGLITGRFPDPEEMNDLTNPTTVIAKLASCTAQTYKTNLSLSETDSLPGDDGYMYLVDVQVTSNTETFTLPFMIIFYDQIIGVSIANI